MTDLFIVFTCARCPRLVQIITCVVRHCKPDTDPPKLVLRLDVAGETQLVDEVSKVRFFGEPPISLMCFLYADT